MTSLIIVYDASNDMFSRSVHRLYWL